MPIGSHGCLDGFAILHPKLLKYVLNVLCLANKCTLFAISLSFWIELVGACKLICYIRARGHEFESWLAQLNKI
jgi:hypothetical protein